MSNIPGGNYSRSDRSSLVSSIGSADSGFGADDVKGRFYDRTVTTGNTTEKPSNFLGWIKSFFSGLFGSSSTTTSPKITEPQNFGRIAQSFADIADAAVQNAPKNRDDIQIHANMSREEANKAAGAFERGDIEQAKGFAETAKFYAEKAADLAATEMDDKDNQPLEKLLKVTSGSQDDDELTPKDVAELAVRRNINQNEKLLRHLNTLSQGERSETISQMITYKQHDNQETSISLENSQQRRALGQVLKDKGIIYDHQSKMFVSSNE